MREFIEVTGKTEEEAVAKALAQLGLDRDDVSVEILERAKSGFLGLGSCPAKVRVSYGEETDDAPVSQEEPQAPQTAAPAPKQEKKQEKKDVTVKRTTIQANSKEELLEKISELDWSKITEEKATQGMKFDITI